MPYVVATPSKSRGIYEKWDELKKIDKQVYKKFETRDECQRFLSKIYEHHQLLENENVIGVVDYVELFTDGGALNNGTKKAITSIGVYIPLLNFELSELTPFSTSSQAELFAAKRGIDKIRDNEELKDKTILLMTDSNFVIYALWDTDNLIIVHVRSHTNAKDKFSRGNQKVDDLASKALFEKAQKLNVKVGGRVYKMSDVDPKTLSSFVDDENTRPYIKHFDNN